MRQQLLFDHLDLRHITFFGQDWGGLVGLRLVALDPDRYARVAIGNTGLPTGHGPASDAFMAWQKFSQETPVFDIGFLINAATTTDLAPEVIAGYDAPFPDDSYQAGARKHLPNAEITFDAFHVIQLANEALEQVRRAEVKTEPGLRHSRWIWLKDRSRWNMRQINQFHDLRRSRLKTTRAWHLKESLRELYACAADREHAAILFSKWYQWARRCRLEPFKRLALTLKKHLQGVLNAFDSRLSNGRVEGINSLIQAAKARARGYRTSDNLITMAYLIAGKLVHLPAAPYRRAAKPSAAALSPT